VNEHGEVAQLLDDTMKGIKHTVPAALFRAGVLNTSVSCDPRTGELYGGNPTEQAIVKGCREFVDDFDNFDRRYVKKFEIPFNSANKYMLCVHEDCGEAREVENTLDAMLHKKFHMGILLKGAGNISHAPRIAPEICRVVTSSHYKFSDALQNNGMKFLECGAKLGISHLLRRPVPADQR
jgi:magnesium-transporting ATPase (P-type)